MIYAAHEGLDGMRLAFAQNGPLGVKLVLVTPPVTTINHGARGEATWSPRDMPLAYEAAPTLASNYRVSDCPALMKLIDNAGRSTPVAKFASSFRTRRKLLPGEVGRELVTVFDRFKSSGAEVAQTYIDALPYPPPCIDDDRKETYHRVLQEAETGIRIDYRFAIASRCAPRRARRA